MAEYKDKNTNKSKASEEGEEVQPESLKNEELSEDVDDLLDEIDSVLEENAEQFVNSYIQKGGQ